MKQWFILISFDMLRYHKEGLCTLIKGQRSRVCEQLFLSSVVPLVANGGGGSSIGTLTHLQSAAIFVFKHMS